jgi:hypothetical protein
MQRASCVGADWISQSSKDQCGPKQSGAAVFAYTNEYKWQETLFDGRLLGECGFNCLKWSATHGKLLRFSVLEQTSGVE